ncbi:MAG: HD domain-containing protein [Clostridia bacterium]|nr:HD domain-containing protein [Clostridia bacterium]
MITLNDIKKDQEVLALFKGVSTCIKALGYTEHSERHCGIVSNWAGEILKAVGEDERTIELGKIAGYLHDIGNAVNRSDHAKIGAMLAYQLLLKRGMDANEATQIMMAIGNHDEDCGVPVNNICSALIIADKSDVHFSRVIDRNVHYELMDIHDRVNFAVEKSFIEVKEKQISTNITVNTKISPVMDYFEIYATRMQMCRRAARFLNYEYALIINGIKIV